MTTPPPIEQFTGASSQLQFQQALSALLNYLYPVLGNIEGNLNFTTLQPAVPVSDTDLMLIRQGSENKKITAEVIRSELATLAVAAKIAAEAARDAALIQAGVYVDEPAGRAAVSDGQAFKVQGSGDVAAYEYRRVNSSSSTLIATYPSLAGMLNATSRTNDLLVDAGAAIYKGTNNIKPLVLDDTGSIVLGYSLSEQRLVGFGVGYEGMQEFLGDRKQSEYIGDGPVWPIVTDKYNRVLLAYDADKDRIVGPGIGQNRMLPPAHPEPLDAALRPVSKTLNHLLMYGQSLSVGSAAGGVISTSQPYNNVTWVSGPRADGNDYSALVPLVEMVSNTLGETPCSGAANYASTRAAEDNGVMPSSHVILASTAGLGGQPIANLKKGTSQYNNEFLLHITNGKARNSDYALHAVGWIQGENDAVTSKQTPYAEYRADLEQMQADIETDAKAISGQLHPVFLLTYQVSYAAATWPYMALAQLDLAQKNEKFYLVTPCYHLQFASDNVHLTAAGYKHLGAYFGRAYKQLVIDKVKPKWLNPLSATRRGQEVRVRFDVPMPPMVLDTTTMAATQDLGFRVTDGAGATVALTSIEVDGSDLVLALAAVPVGAAKVRYALDYIGTGLTFTGGASGNLRDSTPDSIIIGGVSKPLYNVSPHFELPIIALGE